MGDLGVKSVNNASELQAFTKHLLNDVKALEYMLKEGWFDIETIRIGAEQELCLVDQHLKPYSVAMPLIEKAQNPDFVTEIAKFNLEINFAPLAFAGNCLSALEKDINQNLQTAHELADSFDAQIVLAGILPTIRKFDLNHDNLTPYERYKALLSAIGNLRGSDHDLKINGTDELNIKLESAFIEGCNTGFQVHMQIKPDEFVDKYNISQAVAGPTLALAANSPFLFGKRLWKETRVALFQQSIDTRNTSDHLRERSPRVTFGHSWLKGSILDIYREDIMRFRILLHSTIEEDAMEAVRNGKVPSLKALTTHNSTVYRWNRPCYGVGGPKPHLRIENRILPSGPTVIDEVANAALWLGLMNGMQLQYPDITKVMDFDDAKSNFLAAARNGMDTKFNWVGKKKYPAAELIKHELIPLAREGLKAAHIDKQDIDRYMDVLSERNHNYRNGAQWMLHSFSKIRETSSREEALTAITAAMAENQKTGKPVHSWELASVADIKFWSPTQLLVEEFMTTDLFTVQEDDPIELVGEMMDWRKIRNVPVENDAGELVGLVTYRLLLRHYMSNGNDDETLVKNIMIHQPATIHPESSILQAIEFLREKRIGCLPVVKNGKLVGIITDTNFLQISQSLMKRLQ